MEATEKECAMNKLAQEARVYFGSDFVSVESSAVCVTVNLQTPAAAARYRSLIPVCTQDGCQLRFTRSALQMKVGPPSAPIVQTVILVVNLLWWILYFVYATGALF